jgi:hypothetical protein
MFPNPTPPYPHPTPTPPSVERMVEYRDEAEEAPAIMQPRPPPTWPAAGALEAQKLAVRYRPGLPLVLKVRFDRGLTGV